MIRNVRYDERYETYEGEAEGGFLGYKIEVGYEKEELLNYGIRCVKELHNLGEGTVIELTKYLVKYCDEFQDEIFDEDDEERVRLKDDKDVFNYVRFTFMEIPNEEVEDEVINLIGECDWEIEHGVQVVIKGGKVLYVGAVEMVDHDDDLKNHVCNYVE